MLPQANVSADDLQGASVTLRRLEHLWIRASDLVQRPQRLASPGFWTRNRELQDRATRYSKPSSELGASRRVLCLSKCFERVTDKIMAIAERNVRMPLRAVMVVGRVAHL
jgi:hypothetical protein